MASTYTGLGTQLMTTGEKAGTWGTLTNTNWNISEQISGGYISQALSTTGATTLAVNDGTTGAALANRVIEFTAALAGNVTVTIPLDVEQLYVIKNSCTNSYSVEFKYVSGSGSSVTWASGDTGTKIVYATANDATNPDIVDATSAFVTATSTTTLSNKTLTAPKFADGGFIADANGAEALVFGAASTAVNELKITNAATGAGPNLSSISTSGTDSNIDINITPAGTGDVVLAGDTVKVGDAAAAATLTSNGAGTLTVTTGGTTDLILNTNGGTNAGDITFTDGANGDIDFTCNGTGNLVFNDAAYNPATTLTDAATITWDAQAKPITAVTLTANRILAAPTNGQAGQFISLLIIQDAGGTNTLTWNAVFEFPSETAPTLTSTGDLADLFVFRYHNSKWLQVGSTLALTVA
jgi:hypothetical protein